MAISFQPSEPLGNFLNEISAIGSKGRFNEQMKLPKPPAPRALTPFYGPSIPSQGSSANTGVTAGTGAVGGDLGRLLAAIKGQESGGRYGVQNAGSGALGAYQILWSNLAANNGSDWDRQALGRDVSRNEFLSNPAIQDQIAQFKLGQLLKSRGMAGAAATWYGGDWGYNHMYDKRPQNGYPSMYEYVMAILNRAK